MKTTKKIDQDQAKSALWIRGELSWKLHSHQKPIYRKLREVIDNNKNKMAETAILKYVLNCSRRFGKTTVLIMLAVEEALRAKNRHIRFASATGKEVRKSIQPIMQLLLEDCPPNIKPQFNQTDGSYKFYNGSEIHIAGVNNGHEDDLRGANSHLNIVDEAGMIDNLKYLVQSVLIPMALTAQAPTIMASTPALTLDHDFYQFYTKAAEENNLSEFTIFDNTSIDNATRNLIMMDNGGPESTTWQREYLCKWVVDASLDIIPEWSDDYIYTQPEHDQLFKYYFKYTCMDIGINDFTAILYGYYDFQRATLYIEHEDIINGPELTTEKIAACVHESERSLYESNIRKRIADNNDPLLLQDLNHIYGLTFRGTNKDSLDAMVNRLRLFIDQGKLRVHSSCEHTIGCLRHAIWKKTAKKREFARSAKYGHYDALASLVYFVRNIREDENINPVPSSMIIGGPDVFQNTNTNNELKKVFRR